MLRCSPIVTHSFVARNPPCHPSVERPQSVGDDGPPWGLLAHEGLSVHLDADVFVFDNSRRDDDRDVITDFRPGKDKIDLSRTARFGGADFDELLAAAEQIRGDIVINLGSGTLKLEAVDLTDLDAEDFIF